MPFGILAGLGKAVKNITANQPPPQVRGLNNFNNICFLRPDVQIIGPDRFFHSRLLSLSTKNGGNFGIWRGKIRPQSVFKRDFVGIWVFCLGLNFPESSFGKSVWPLLFTFARYGVV